MPCAASAAGSPVASTTVPVSALIANAKNESKATRLAFGADTAARCTQPPSAPWWNTYAAAPVSGGLAPAAGSA